MKKTLTLLYLTIAVILSSDPSSSARSTSFDAPKVGSL